MIRVWLSVPPEFFLDSDTQDKINVLIKVGDIKLECDFLGQLRKERYPVEVSVNGKVETCSNPNQVLQIIKQAIQQTKNSPS